MAPRSYRVGRKIAMYGNSGSGKTTVGRELGRRLGVPYIELDAVFHYRPKWEDREAEDFKEQVRLLLTQHTDGWVFDGNYSVVRELILPEADTAVWLKLPWVVVYSRLAWRTISRAARRQPLWNGNEETLKQTFLSKDSMLLWGITSWRRSRRNTAQALRETPHNAAIHVLRSPRAVRAFLGRTPAPPPSRARKQENPYPTSRPRPSLPPGRPAAIIRRLTPNLAWRPTPMLTFKHYTVAVHDLDASVENYKQRFGMEPTGEKALNRIGNFNFVPMGYAGQTVMHLICPVSDESPIARLMKERVNAFNPHGEGIYLLAFDTADVEAFTKQVEGAGGRVTRGAPGTTNVWVHPTASNFVLMEIFQARS